MPLMLSKPLKRSFRVGLSAKCELRRSFVDLRCFEAVGEHMRTALTPDDPLNDSGFVPTDDRPPICSTCGVTMVPAELSARGVRDRDWACLECEETDHADGA